MATRAVSGECPKPIDLYNRTPKTSSIPAFGEPGFHPGPPGGTQRRKRRRRHGKVGVLPTPFTLFSKPETQGTNANMVRTKQPNATETKNDASLPDCRTLYRSDAKLQKACDAFARIHAAARSAGRNPEKLTNGLLHALVFEARNDAGTAGTESLNALARRGRVRKDLWNGDVRPAVESLLAFAAKGGELTEREFAAREAEFAAAVGGPARTVFRRLVATAFPAKAVAVSRSPCGYI